MGEGTKKAGWSDNLMKASPTLKLQEQKAVRKRAKGKGMSGETTPGEKCEEIKHYGLAKALLRA